MKKAKIILGLGIWLAVLPYLGFPYFIKNLIISASSLLVAYIGFMLYKHHSIIEGGEEESFDTFTENKDFIVGNATDTNAEITELKDEVNNQ